MRHQRHFAETAGAFVGVEDLVENFLATRRLGLDNASFLEADRDAFDQRALIGQRLGADDVTMNPLGMRRGEDLFRRNIRIASDAVLCRGAAALPFMSVGKTDCEVGAGSGEMQRAESLPVQPLPSAAQYLVVSVPGRDGVIPVDPGSGENGVRKLCHRSIFFVLRKYELRP